MISSICRHSMWRCLPVSFEILPFKPVFLGLIELFRYLASNPSSLKRRLLCPLFVRRLQLSIINQFYHPLENSFAGLTWTARFDRTQYPHRIAVTKAPSKPLFRIDRSNLSPIRDRLPELRRAKPETLSQAVRAELLSVILQKIQIGCIESLECFK